MDEFLDGGFDAMSDEEAEGVDEDEDMDLAAVADGEYDDDEDEGGRPTAADAEDETDGGESSREASLLRLQKHLQKLLHALPRTPLDSTFPFRSFLPRLQRTKGTWQKRTLSLPPSPPSTSGSSMP